MSFNVPWVTIIAALLGIAALFFVMKSFKMPSSFHKNQEKRAEIQKKIKERESPPPSPPKA